MMAQNKTFISRFKLIIWFSKFHCAVMKFSGGRLMNSFMGLDMLLLETMGRKSGKRRVTPLLYVNDDENGYLCVASFGGNSQHPEWFKNVRTSNYSVLKIKTGSVSVSVKVLEGDERLSAWAKVTRYYPPYKKYQERTSRPIPIVKFSPCVKTQRD